MASGAEHLNGLGDQCLSSSRDYPCGYLSTLLLEVPAS